jgi:Type IV secretion-system coupling protein DNA-binding domain
MPTFERTAEVIGLGALVALPGGYVLASVLRRRRLLWSWAALGLPATYLLLGRHLFGLALYGAFLLACALGAAWHYEDLDHGADIAEAARARMGMADVLRRQLRRRRVKRRGWLSDGRLALGQDRRGVPVSIPVGYESGSHTLVLGATGAGKTVSEAWIACRLIEDGHGAVVIDPKGDRMLREQLMLSAQRTGARFLEWTPHGPFAYNPYANGSETEIADKALSGEVFTEPHYLRQAQRYLGHAVRTMQAAGVDVTPVSLMAQLDPRELDVLARGLPEQQASETQRYLDSLSDRQKRDLGGVRDRLSILAESDARAWLDPSEQRELLDIEAAVRQRAVVYFRLDSDRRPLLAAMLAAAIVSDLIALVARLQAQPIPTAVLIDEFSAVAAEHTARLFGRGRSAGISLILGTQELADLKSAGDGALKEQTLGNVATIVAHRQNVPESAELIAEIAGTQATWTTTQQTERSLLGSRHSGRGSRRRGYEFRIHPTQIKQLRTGEAVVLTPGAGEPATVAVHHPAKARAAGKHRANGPRPSGLPSLRHGARRLAGPARPGRARCARPFRSLHRRLFSRITTTRSTRRNP